MPQVARVRVPDRMSLVNRIVPAGLTVVLIVLLGRVVQLQVLPSERLREQITPRSSVASDTPRRGDIFDRRGRVISSTRFGYRVVLDPSVMKQPDAVVEPLAAALGLDAEALGGRISDAAAVNRGVEAFRTSVADDAQGLYAMFPEVFEYLRQKRGGEGGTSVAPAQGAGLRAPGEKPARTTFIRYLPVSEVIGDAQAESVRKLRLPGVVLERRPVREYPGGEVIAPIIGLVGFEDEGMMGAEMRLDHELKGEAGSISYVRDKRGRPLWVEPGQIRPALPGGDVRLSIDLELQRMAHEELSRGVEDADAAGGRLVMLDPLTGEILAMVDLTRSLSNLAGYPWGEETRPAKNKNKAALAKAGTSAVPERKNVWPDLPVVPLGSPARYMTILPDPRRDVHPALGRNRCVEDIYEPGSTFKPFVWSTITELGLARPGETFDTEGGRWHTGYGRFIEDVTKRATMTWSDVLVNSSNIGMIKASERLSWAQLHDVPVRFGFGRPTGIGLPGEASGIVTPLNKWTKFSQTSYAYGHEVAVTPLQMARAFAAFCRPGELAGTMPQVHLTAVDPAPNAKRVGPAELQKGVIYRVMQPETANLTRTTMKGVADAAEGKMKLMKTPDCDTAWRYHMFGKSGTAEIPLTEPPPGKRRPRGSSGYFEGQYNSSFIAGAPIESPRIVVIVVIDDPGPERIRKRQHYGTYVAGPVVRRVVERALTYLGAPPSSTADHTVVASAP